MSVEEAAGVVIETRSAEKEQVTTAAAVWMTRLGVSEPVSGARGGRAGLWGSHLLGTHLPLGQRQT